MKRFFKVAKFLAVPSALVSLLIALPAETKLKNKDKFPDLKLSVLSAGKGSRVPASASKLSIGDFKGKVVLVDFWASWCEPCKIALPAYDKMYSKYKADGLVVVGINVDDERGDGVNFLKNNPVKFPVLYDEGKKLIGQVEVVTMPTSFLIGKDGKVHHIHKGFREGDKADVEKLIKKLL